MVLNKRYNFGNKVTSEIGDFILVPNTEDMSEKIGGEYKVVLNPLFLVAQEYKDKIQVSVTNELSNVITISLEEAVEQKGKDIINGLIDTYNGNAIEDKRLIANRTSEFINDRILEIYGDLSTVDQSAQEFKSGRGITDVGSHNKQ